jgi:hypothetical protein
VDFGYSCLPDLERLGQACLDMEYFGQQQTHMQPANTANMRLGPRTEYINKLRMAFEVGLDGISTKPPINT